MIKPINDPAYPWLGATFGIFLLGVWYWCTDQVIVQRALAGKSLSHARGGAILTAFLKVLPLFIFVVPGLIARVLWQQEVQANPDMSYPLLVMRLLPIGTVGLIIASFLAALMSSLSSVFNSCSTLITMDIYRKIKPGSSEKTLVLVGRLCTVVIVVVSIAWIPMIHGISNQLYQYLQSVQAVIGAPIAAIFLTGILWKRATGKAALSTLIIGGLAGLARFITDVMASRGYHDFGPFNILTGYAFLNYAVIMFGFCVLLMVVISLLTEKPRKEQVEGLTWSVDTVAEGIDKTWTWLNLGLSVLVMVVVITIWAHFA